MATERFDSSTNVPTFLTLDFCEELPSDFTFRCAVDRGCLHALKKNDRLPYVSNIASCVEPGGYFLLLHKVTVGQADGATRELSGEEVAAPFHDAFEIVSQAKAEIGSSRRSVPGVAIMMKRRSEPV